MTDQPHTTNPSVVTWIEEAVAGGEDPTVMWNIGTDKKSLSIRAVYVDHQWAPDEWGEIIDELVRQGRVIRHEDLGEDYVAIPAKHDGRDDHQIRS